MADYTQLGSFNTGGAASLNGELIQKLYDAEEKSIVKPIEKNLELWDTEKEKITEINTKVNELLAAIKPFDLFTTGTSAFDNKSASVVGDAALFDASDVNALKPGKTVVTVTELAQKQSFESTAFTSKTDLLTGQGNIIMMSTDVPAVEMANFDTEGKSYETIAKEINQNGQFDASIQQVSDTEFKLIIKSKEPGIDNAFTMNTSDSTYTEVLAAKNLEATIDGVSFNLSSNSITLDGNLKITASKVGESTLSVDKDDSSIIPAVKEVATKYNELLLMVTEELYSDEASSKDKGSLRSLLNDLKNMMYNEYGKEDSNLLNIGFSFDKDGVLTIDEKILGKAITDDSDKVKDLFIGVAEDKGFGTLLKEHIDTLNSSSGLFKSYQNNMDIRKEKLTKDKEQAVENLDTKYDTMAAQFSAYATIISQMESSFGALKQMIAAENSSN